MSGRQYSRTAPQPDAQVLTDEQWEQQLSTIWHDVTVWSKKTDRILTQTAGLNSYMSAVPDDLQESILSHLQEADGKTEGGIVSEMGLAQKTGYLLQSAPEDEYVLAITKIYADSYNILKSLVQRLLEGQGKLPNEASSSVDLQGQLSYTGTPSKARRSKADHTSSKRGRPAKKSTTPASVKVKPQQQSRRRAQATARAAAATSQDEANAYPATSYHPIVRPGESAGGMAGYQHTSQTIQAQHPSNLNRYGSVVSYGTSHVPTASGPYRVPHNDGNLAQTTKDDVFHAGQWVDSVYPANQKDDAENSGEGDILRATHEAASAMARTWPGGGDIALTGPPSQLPQQASHPVVWDTFTEYGMGTTAFGYSNLPGSINPGQEQSSLQDLTDIAVAQGAYEAPPHSNFTGTEYPTGEGPYAGHPSASSRGQENAGNQFPGGGWQYQ